MQIVLGLSTGGCGVVYGVVWCGRGVGGGGNLGLPFNTVRVTPSAPCSSR